MPPAAVPIDQRFWAKVRLGPGDDPCWFWTDALDEHGRGRLNVNRQPELAHRIAWFLVYGYWPEYVLRHSCNNPSCVNTLHLLEGTQEDNVHDATRLGRHGPSKLTIEQVHAIRSEYRPGVYGLVTKMTKKYGISRYQIWNIVTGRQRTDV